MTKILPFMAFFVCASTFLTAQLTYTVDTATVGPVVTISGASTLHGWTATAGEITEYPVSLSLDLTTDSEIQDFGFTVSVESLDGGRGSAMNEKIYKAFDSMRHPDIVFLQSGSITIPSISEGNKVSLTISGTISMAGHSVEVRLPLDLSIIDGNAIFSGAYPMKMSDYGITPPSAMFGQIVTEDDIEVQYSFTYRK